MTKAQVGELGTKRDRDRRKKDRVDDTRHSRKIERVRKWIYEKGRKITGAAVERVLGTESLAPNKVTTLSQNYLPADENLIERVFLKNIVIHA